MKNILLIDDDNVKISKIVTFINEKNEYSITIANALNPGLKKVLKESYDFILLDMSLPTFDSAESGYFNSFGGIDFLKEMKRKKITIPVIIVTQYEIFGEGSGRKTSEDIDVDCKKIFNNYVGIVIFSSTNDNWKSELLKCIGEING